MDNIQIDTGVKKILINGGPAFIQFNPSDVLFAERFYQLMKDFQDKKEEFQKRGEVIEANQEKDASGIPLNAPDGMALTREICEFTRSKIDYVFGDGTSQILFGDALVIGMFEQFFTEITPYIQKVRIDKVAKYTSPPPIVKKTRKKHIGKK